MRNRQSYTEMKEIKKQKKLAAGLISERFPKVSSIIIKMAYFHNATNPIVIRTVYALPVGYAYFNMECLEKGCADGGFDLTPVIISMANSHKESVKGKLVCKGKSDELPSGHANIAYEVTIRYNKNVKRIKNIKTS